MTIEVIADNGGLVFLIESETADIGGCILDESYSVKIDGVSLYEYLEMEQKQLEDQDVF